MQPLYYRDGYKIQVFSDYTYDQEGIWFDGVYDTPWLRLAGKTITIKATFASDGPSGPTIDSPCSIRGAIKHDAGYALIRAGVLPITAKSVFDDQLKHDVIQDGMNRIRAWYWHRGVVAFGAVSIRPSAEKPIKVAP
jgi:hypothetical protein